MTPQLILALAIAAMGFGSAWTIQEWRYGAKEAEHAQQELVDQRQSAATAIRRIDNTLTAQSAATARDVGLRADAAGVRVALVGLHDAAAGALRDAAASESACLERAATIAKLLDTVAAAGGELAAKADRHANDAVMLLAGWPK